MGGVTSGGRGASGRPGILPCGLVLEPRPTRVRGQRPPGLWDTVREHLSAPGARLAAVTGPPSAPHVSLYLVGSPLGLSSQAFVRGLVTDLKADTTSPLGEGLAQATGQLLSGKRPQRQFCRSPSWLRPGPCTHRWAWQCRGERGCTRRGLGRRDQLPALPHLSHGRRSHPDTSRLLAAPGKGSRSHGTETCSSVHSAGVCSSTL